MDFLELFVFTAAVICGVQATDPPVCSGKWLEQQIAPHCNYSINDTDKPLTRWGGTMDLVYDICPTEPEVQALIETYTNLTSQFPKIMKENEELGKVRNQTAAIVVKILSIMRNEYQDVQKLWAKVLHYRVGVWELKTENNVVLRSTKELFNTTLQDFKTFREELGE